jgi:ABC-type multidrug transport system fused ATPase/permease subunit
MLEILDEPHEIIDHSETVLQVNAGKIEFVNIQFAYNESKQIFNGLDLRIKPGEKIAIVGQS